ncbi:MAG: hypothetical protein HQL98_14790 [Magnetococcales bacterium]|nr:hypothetical protein [Magnetococcales bacterium]
MELKITPQGFLDGACLLYAVVNACKVLLDPELSVSAFYQKYQMENKWGALIAVVPSPINHLNGSGSALGLKVGLEQQALDAFFGLACNIFSTGRNRLRVKRLTAHNFRRKTDYRSVVVFAVTEAAQTRCFCNGSHWMVAVARQPETLCLACSSALYCCDPYLEECDPATGHFFNNSMPHDQLANIYGSSIYQMEII